MTLLLVRLFPVARFVRMPLAGGLRGASPGCQLVNLPPSPHRLPPVLLPADLCMGSRREPARLSCRER